MKRWNVLHIEQTIADLEKILAAFNQHREVVLSNLEQARRELAAAEQKNNEK